MAPARPLSRSHHYSIIFGSGQIAGRRSTADSFVIATVNGV